MLLDKHITIRRSHLAGKPDAPAAAGVSPASTSVLSAAATPQDAAAAAAAGDATSTSGKHLSLVTNTVPLSSCQAGY